MFLQIREIARGKITDMGARLFPGLDATSVAALTDLALALADGLFVHREAAAGDVDLVALFELHARLLGDAAARMAADRLPQTPTHAAAPVTGPGPRPTRRSVP